MNVTAHLVAGKIIELEGAAESLRVQLSQPFPHESYVDGIRTSREFMLSIAETMCKMIAEKNIHDIVDDKVDASTPDGDYWCGVDDYDPD